MGTEQLEGQDRKGKKRIVISTPGQPDKVVYTDKTFENAPIVRKNARKRTETPKNAPKMPEISFSVPLNISDVIWKAYQRGFRDGQLKEKQS